MTVMTESPSVFFGPEGALKESAFSQAGYMGAQLIRGIVLRDSATDDPANPSTWQRTDAFVASVRAHGFAPYLTLSYRPPNWGGAGVPLALPNAAEFGAYCGAAATRYRGQVADYSVWNEPNHLLVTNPAGAAPSSILPASYGELYRSCWNAIKAVDPAAHVYFGELSTGASACDYLANALTSTPTFTDGLAIHPYQVDRSPDQSDSAKPCKGIGHLEDWNARLASARANATFATPVGGRVPLMVTEFGYCAPDDAVACSPDFTDRSEATRAAWIRSAFEAARNAGVTLFSYYHLVKSGYGWDTGIVNADGSRTASVGALHTAASPAAVITGGTTDW